MTKTFQSLSNAKTSHVLVLLFLALTWGSSFMLMKRGLFDSEGNPVFSPNQVAALRLTIAGIVLLPLSIPAIRRTSMADLKWIAIVGLMGSGIPAFLFTNSQRYIDSGLAGILNALTPLFTLLAGIIIFRKTTRTRQIVGVLMGLVGAACLISLNGIGNLDNWCYSLLIVAATMSYGYCVNLVQHRLPHMKAYHITSIAQLFLVIPAIIIAFSTDVPLVLHTNPDGWKSMGYIVVLAVGGTAIANILYFWLTLQTSAIFASSVTYVMPLVALAWAVADRERLTVWHGVFAGIILTGVYLVNQRFPVTPSPNDKNP